MIRTWWSRLWSRRRVGQRETYTTGTGQVLENVHRRRDCEGWCVIHNPHPGPWDQGDWMTHWRGDQTVSFGGFEFAVDTWQGFERICPHGVGHTAIEETLRGNYHSHGCDGCCFPDGSKGRCDAREGGD